MITFHFSTSTWAFGIMSSYIHGNGSIQFIIYEDVEGERLILQNHPIDACISSSCASCCLGLVIFKFINTSTGKNQQGVEKLCSTHLSNKRLTVKLYKGFHASSLDFNGPSYSQQLCTANEICVHPKDPLWKERELREAKEERDEKRVRGRGKEYKEQRSKDRWEESLKY